MVQKTVIVDEININKNSLYTTGLGLVTEIILVRIYNRWLTSPFNV